MQRTIIFDVETTGLIPGKHQIVSIGAIDSETGETFYEECRIYHRNKITSYALQVNGFTEDQVRDSKKQSPLQLYRNFVKWCNGRSKLLGGHNIGSFDVQFLKVLCFKGKNQKWPFKYQYVDTHSIAFNYFGESMGLDTICDRLEIPREPIIHNALNGAKVELECLLKMHKNSEQ